MRLTLALLTFLLAALPLRAETWLLMAEETGCMWCERWNDEIAHIYPKTAEGKFAPLRRLDIHDPLPQDFTLKTDLHFTPTFVLVHDGHEVGRIEGYPGEDFFWGLLSRVFTRAGIDLDSTG